MVTVSSEMIMNALNSADKVLRDVFGEYYKTPKIQSIKMTSASSYWMKISKVGCDHYKLSVSKCFNNYDTSEHCMNRLTESMIHELIHTMSGAWNHGDTFKYYGRRVHSMFPKYNVSRESSGGVGYTPEVVKKVPKYNIVCNNCGKVYKYFRICNAIRNVSDYYCARCKSRNLSVIKNY